MSYNRQYFLFLAFTFIVIFGVGFFAAERKHTVVHKVEPNEVAVVHDLHNNKGVKVYRAPETVTYDDQQAVLHSYKTHGGIYSCSLSVRFNDGISAALCGAIEIELSRNDQEIAVLDADDGLIKAMDFAWTALHQAVSICSTKVSAVDISRTKGADFYSCAEVTTRQAIDAHPLVGITFPSIRIEKMEFDPEVQLLLERLAKKDKI